MGIVSVTPGYTMDGANPQTITIILTGPVGSLTIVGNGAIECSGNYGQLIAYDANGAQLATSALTLIDPTDCSPPWLPDNITYGAQGTVTAPIGIIAKVEITAMSPLYTSSGFAATQTYTVSLAPGTPIPCVAVGDSILDAPGIVSDLEAALAASNPNATPGTGVKKEQGGAIWQRLDGTYFAVPAVDPNATECHFDPLTIAKSRPASDSGAVIAAIYHTHPSAKGEDTYGCLSKKGMRQAQTKGDGLPVPTADPNANGGGSDADWNGTFGYPSYTINKEGKIWRLDGATPVANRSQNPNHWDFKNAPPGCLVP